jgi:hypothetical protein
MSDEPDPRKLDETAAYVCNSARYATTGIPYEGLHVFVKQGPTGYTLLPKQTHPDEFGSADAIIEGEPPIGHSLRPIGKWLRIFGCVAYFDQFKTLHWTRFCVISVTDLNSAEPRQKLCPNYNDTDETDEKDSEQ